MSRARSEGGGPGGWLLLLSETVSWDWSGPEGTLAGTETCEQRRESCQVQNRTVCELGQEFHNHLYSWADPFVFETVTVQTLARYSLQGQLQRKELGGLDGGRAFGRGLAGKPQSLLSFSPLPLSFAFPSSLVSCSEQCPGVVRQPKGSLTFPPPS